MHAVTTHVLISLLEIPLGGFLIISLWNQRSPRALSVAFLSLAALTSITGLLLPSAGFKPSHAVGILSLMVVAVAWFAVRIRRLEGAWRSRYAASVVLLLYFDVFVAIAQSFLKVTALRALAPTSTEPPFIITQLLGLTVFIACGIVVASRFKRAPAGAAE